MNSSRKLIILLLGSGLLATSPVFAQGKGSNASPSPSPSQPITPPPSQTERPTPRSDVNQPDRGIDRPMPPETPAYPQADPRSRLNRPADETPVNPVETPAVDRQRRGTTTYGASQFKTLDLDNDGRLSRSEFIGSIIETPGSSRTAERDRVGEVTATNTEAEFAVLDADKDGYLSQSELASAHGKTGR